MEGTAQPQLFNVCWVERHSSLNSTHCEYKSQDRIQTRSRSLKWTTSFFALYRVLYRLLQTVDLNCRVLRVLIFQGPFDFSIPEPPPSTRPPRPRSSLNYGGDFRWRFGKNWLGPVGVTGSTSVIGISGISCSYGYGSIPIHTIFSGMNIHLPAILMFTRGIGFWPIPICSLDSITWTDEPTTGDLPVQFLNPRSSRWMENPFGSVSIRGKLGGLAVSFLQ